MIAVGQGAPPDTAPFKLFNVPLFTNGLFASSTNTGGAVCRYVILCFSIYSSINPSSNLGIETIVTPALGAMRRTTTRPKTW